MRKFRQRKNKKKKNMGKMSMLRVDGTSKPRKNTASPYHLFSAVFAVADCCMLMAGNFFLFVSKKR
ncbi:MAG: hypothetical protein DRP83_02335 [Planctomycetota bacterium]|nr:MAG: hypothetical protein DRP83_02335 [Planctomycetota bacterium]